MEAFMQEYDLSSEEGVVLMCLAEALLRIPDSDTAEKLIADKLADANWEAHLGKSSSLFVNASTWGLMLTGRLVRVGTSSNRDIGTTLAKIANKSGEPVLRLAIRQAMRIMGFQYVMGRTIKEALERAAKKQNQDYRYSFDMLGEAALTADDADRYLESYSDAIAAIGASYDGDDIFAAPSISVKLSALHPRYEYSQRDRVMAELPARLTKLVYLARQHNVGITVDAEESDRLLLSLDVFAEVFADPGLENWNGLGLALQCYLKRCPAVIDWLAHLAKTHRRRIPVRLVKGAYWDSEIKECQVNGLSGYPVYTRKVNTDVAYIACARQLLTLPTSPAPANCCGTGRHSTRSLQVTTRTR
jgi:RHH-type proline utilization regulon transcriptional repressor/proline dehydrogenase/delta 1-pyrroline-5-carboxylate dehydrogenase